MSPQQQALTQAESKLRHYQTEIDRLTGLIEQQKTIIHTLKKSPSSAWKQTIVNHIVEVLQKNHQNNSEEIFKELENIVEMLFKQIGS